jgi:hypothetical protein
LPLIDGRNNLSRVLGAMTPVLNHGFPHPLLGRCRLLSYELVWPDGRPHAPAASAEKAATRFPPGPGSTHGTAVRRFRVLDGGRSARKNDGH